MGDGNWVTFSLTRGGKSSQLEMGQGKHNHNTISHFLLAQIKKKISLLFWLVLKTIFIKYLCHHKIIDCNV